MELNTSDGEAPEKPMVSNPSFIGVARTAQMRVEEESIVNGVIELSPHDLQGDALSACKCLLVVDTVVSAVPAEFTAASCFLRHSGADVAPKATVCNSIQDDISHCDLTFERFRFGLEIDRFCHAAGFRWRDHNSSTFMKCLDGHGKFFDFKQWHRELNLRELDLGVLDIGIDGEVVCRTTEGGYRCARSKREQQ